MLAVCPLCGDDIGSRYGFVICDECDFEMPKDDFEYEFPQFIIYE